MAQYNRTRNMDRKEIMALKKEWEPRKQRDPAPFVQLLWLPSLEYQELCRFFNLVVKFLDREFPNDYFPAYGTMLGFVREGRILKHDDDIDFVINKNRLEDLKKYVSMTAIEISGDSEYMKQIGENPLVVKDSRLKYSLILKTEIENKCYSVMKVDDFKSISDWPFVEIFVSDAKIENEVVWSFEDVTLERRRYNAPAESNRFINLPIPVNAEDLLDREYSTDWRHVIKGIIGHKKTHMELCESSNRSRYSIESGELL